MILRINALQAEHHHHLLYSLSPLQQTQKQILQTLFRRNYTQDNARMDLGEHAFIFIHSSRRYKTPFVRTNSSASQFWHPTIATTMNRESKKCFGPSLQATPLWNSNTTSTQNTNKYTRNTAILRRSHEKSSAPGACGIDKHDEK